MTKRADSYGTVRPDPRRRSFAMTPEALIDDLSVPALGVRLWCKLDRIAAGREQAIGSRAALAASLGTSPSTLDRARRALESAGWLGVERVDGEASRYITYDTPTYPQTVVIHGDTQMGVVTGDQPPSSPVTNPPSSLVTTEERGTTRERENPPTPRTAGGGCSAHRNGNGRNCRGCGTSNRARRDADRIAATRRPVEYCADPAHFRQPLPCRLCSADAKAVSA